MLVTKLPDDITPEEVAILNRVAIRLYTKLDDPIDKFIVAMVFDLGYGREETAEALGVSYVTVWNRINDIKEQLKESYAEEGVKV